MQETEHQLPWQLQRARLWNLSSLALVLPTASAGSGPRAVHTPLHLDVTEATNVAFGLQGKVNVYGLSARASRLSVVHKVLFVPVVPVTFWRLVELAAA